jgi:molybdate transport system regulatory protein
MPITHPKRYVNFDLTLCKKIAAPFLASEPVPCYVSRMSKQLSGLQIRSKVWLVDGENNIVLGLGRIKMLEAIQRLGSINAAAKELKISTRAIWGRIKTTEERLGRSLLVRNIGGIAGGGSQLTEFAVALVDFFHFLNRNVKQQSDELFTRAVKDKLTKL